MDKWKGQRSSCCVAKLPIISKKGLIMTITVMMMMVIVMMIMLAIVMIMITFLLQYIEGGGCPLARHSRRTLDPLRTVMLPFRGCRLSIFGGTENCMMMMMLMMIMMIMTVMMMIIRIGSLVA